jgi:hypothetical protein
MVTKETKFTESNSFVVALCLDLWPEEGEQRRRSGADGVARVISTDWQSMLETRKSLA